jgi:hypothetical protein
VVYVGVEALREAEIGLLDLGLPDGTGEPEDLEVAPNLEPFPGIENLATPFRGLVVDGPGPGRRRGRGGRDRRR